MNKNRKTSHILNVFQYDEITGAVTLPSTLVLTAPASNDNSTKVGTTAWVRTYVTGLSYLTGNQSITVSGDVTGSGTTAITLTLANTAVTPGSYGSASLVPVVTVDSKGRITSVTTAAISGSLTFTGDVTGTGTTGTITGLTLAASGVTAGTYTKVTVDTKGRVTVGASSTTSDISEGTNLYYTDARVLSYLSANTYATQSYVGTQISNLVAAAPATLDTLNELAAALGNDPSFATTVSTSIGTKVPQARTITINGTTYDLTANRSWTITSMIYPSAGIAISTGSAWGTSITDNSANWNTAYGWGNHASGGYLTSATAATTYASLTGAYANPAFVASLAYSKITGVPAFITLTSLSGSTGISYNSTTGAISSTITQYTDALARAALSFTAGSGAYNSTTGVITIPTNNNQLINGAGYITGITSANVTTALGFTPVTNARTITINGTGYDLSADRSFTVSASDATKLPLAGGTMTGTITFSPTVGNKIDFYYSGDDRYGIQVQSSELRIHSGAQGASTGGITLGKSTGTVFTEHLRIRNDGNVQVVVGTLSMATSGTSYIRMGVFPNSTSNSGEAWIGRASDRNAGTMTVQLGGASATSRSFEVVDYAWSVVLFSVGSNGNINSSGTITASNYSGTHSGTSSGTNTGDQTNISGTASNITAYTINQSVGTGNSPTFAGLTVNTSGTGTWGPFVVTSTSLWGDGATQYVTIGAGGAAGIMIYNPHIVWDSAQSYAAAKYGRSGGISSGAYYVAGTGASDNFFITKNGTVASPQLNINSSGNATFSGTLSASNLSGTNTGDQTNISGNASTATTATNLTNFTAAYSSAPLNADSPSTLDAIGYVNAGTALFGQTDGGLYSSAYSTAWYHQIFGDFRTGQIAIRGKNAGTWQGWRTVVDSGNVGNYKANGALKLWATSHPSDYYIVNNWTGTYWQLTTNHGSGVQVAYADSAGSAPANGGTSSNTNSISSATGGSYYWSGIQYFETNNGGSAVNNSNSAKLEAYSSSNNSAFMSFHRGGYYAVNFGLDNDNYMRMGGWSAPANRFQLNMTSGDLTVAGFVRSSQNVYIDNNYGCTVTGVYSSTRYQGIWNMGTSWYMPQDGTTPGNLYGLAWSHPNAGGQAGYLATHGLLVMENGNTNTALSNGIWTRGDVTAYSDARVKENVEVITNAIERIKAIRGVTFTRNDREDKTTRFAGVIAQEVLAVLPEVVTEDALGTYSVAYGNLAGLFIEAIKEQQKEIDELKSLINGFTK